MRPTFRFAAALALAGVVFAACSGGATPTPAPTAPAPTEARRRPQPRLRRHAERLRPGEPGDGHGRDADHRTDNPAYPPYFDGDPATPPLEIGNPNNGKASKRRWPTRSPRSSASPRIRSPDRGQVFDNAYAPGPKDFDFDINQVSYTRAAQRST